MKKISIILILASMILFVCSCAVTEPQPTETPTPSAEPVAVSTPEPKSFIPKKEELSLKLCGLYGLDSTLLKKIQEGTFAYAGSIAELPDTVSPEQVELAKKLIACDPEMFFVKDIELAEDGLSINIYYHSEQIQAEKDRQELITKVNSLASSLIKPEYTKFENTLSVYAYLSKNITADSNEKLNSYDLFIKGKANSFGFAKAMQLLLNEAGIESYVTNSAEGEAWVTAKINDTYYHFSPYLESQKTHGQNLEFFGSTDSEMSQFYTFWLVQDGLMEIISDDTTFSYMRNITGYGVNFAQQTIYYVDKLDGNKIVKCSYFQDIKESVYNKRAQDMVYINNVIYFADLDNRNKLCVLDLATGKVEELDSIFVTRMYARSGKLIYFDDVSNTEGSLIIG